MPLSSMTLFQAGMVYAKALVVLGIAVGESRLVE